MNTREGSTIMTASVPNELTTFIDKRVRSLGTSRSQYLVRLVRLDLAIVNSGRDFIIHGQDDFEIVKIVKSKIK